MSLLLKGILTGMRPVEGVIEQGSRAGEAWHFLSMEITDSRYGKVYSCQMRSNDPKYKDLVEAKTVTQKDKQTGKDAQVEKHFVKQDYTGHLVRVTITGQTAGERDIEDKSTGDTRTVMQIRSQVTNFRDLGLPEDEDE